MLNQRTNAPSGDVPMAYVSIWLWYAMAKRNVMMGRTKKKVVGVLNNGCTLPNIITMNIPRKVVLNGICHN